MIGNKPVMEIITYAIIKYIWGMFLETKEPPNILFHLSISSCRSEKYIILKHLLEYFCDIHLSKHFLY